MASRLKIEVSSPAFSDSGTVLGHSVSFVLTRTRASDRYNLMLHYRSDRKDCMEDRKDSTDVCLDQVLHLDKTYITIIGLIGKRTILTKSLVLSSTTITPTRSKEYAIQGQLESLPRIEDFVA